MANGKDAYYFSHDANARNDEKILMLRAEHGWEGYGLFWALIEMMFENNDTCLHHNRVRGIAVSYNIDITVLQSVINTAINEGLFVTDGEKFWSESLRRRKQSFQELRKKRSEAGKKGMVSRWGEPTNTGPDNSVITKNNKVKESKVNKKPSSSKVFDDDSPEITLANKLKDLILQNNPKAKTPDDLQKWAHDIDKMIRIDGREFLEINRIIEFSQNDNFWMSNILSARKLREQYDQLYLQMKKRRPQEAGRLGVPPSKSVLGPRED